MVDYSKFDQIEDSDDEKAPSAPAQAQETFTVHQKLAAQRSAVRAATDAIEAEKAQEANAEKTQDNDAKEEQREVPAHQKDRFAYSDKDITEEVKKDLKEHVLAGCRETSLTFSGGELTLEGCTNVEGETTQITVRGQKKYICDLSFSVKFVFRWMGSNFDEGQKKAEGTIVVSEFTYDAVCDAGSTSGMDNKPHLKAKWVDLGGIDEQRKKDVQDKLGHREWPPPPDTFMSRIYEKLQAWANSLP